MLRVYLVGRVMIESPDRLIEPSDFPGRQGRIAFAYLAASPRRVERDQLADVLWGEHLPGAWQTALNAIVSKLRRILDRAGVDGASVLEASRGCYELRLPEGTWMTSVRRSTRSIWPRERSHTANPVGPGRPQP